MTNTELYQFCKSMKLNHLLTLLSSLLLGFSPNSLLLAHPESDRIPITSHSENRYLLSQRSGTVYTSEKFGFQFSYPSNYILDRDNEIRSSNVSEVYSDAGTLLLRAQEDWEAIQNGYVGDSLGATLIINTFSNPRNLSLVAWAERYRSQSNLQGNYTRLEIDSQPAIYYEWCGLGCGDSIALKSKDGKYIHILSVSGYYEKSDPARRDFQALVASFKLSNLSGRQQESQRQQPESLSINSPLTLTGIGPIQIGMTVSEAQEAAGIRLIPGPNLSRDQTPGSCRFYNPVNLDGVSFMVINNRIVRVDIQSNQFSTLSGARIGNSKSQIFQLYPNNVRRTGGTLGGGDAITYFPDDSIYQNYRLIFETDSSGIVDRMRSGQKPEVEYIEGCL